MKEHVIIWGVLVVLCVCAVYPVLSTSTNIDIQECAGIITTSTFIVLGVLGSIMFNYLEGYHKD